MTWLIIHTLIAVTHDSHFTLYYTHTEWHDSFNTHWVTWLIIHTLIWVTWLVLHTLSDVTHFTHTEWNDSLYTYKFGWHDFFYTRWVTWLMIVISLCITHTLSDMTHYTHMNHLYLWHDSFLCVTCLTYTCDLTYNGMATISKLLQIVGLFCEKSL